MELLSPAGNREALIAAISCGADAVYLGYTAFGARSYAGNFDAEGLRDAVEYAHERGRRIFVTVNTLVKQCEVDDLCDVLELLSNIGVDAALVQDLGAAKLARERFPELVLHASTQMTVNNAQGAHLLRKLGFARVVPARECSLAELRRMADTGVEVEAFAHGALCVAVSGQCLFSSMIGGRSGNRGKCAQPCRLPYHLDDGTSGYLLSTKDLMLIDRLPELRDAGVYSFKLEGRMKRPEYVGVITRAYREALDAAEARVPYHPDEKTLEGLRQIFNRGGFTEGYVMEKSNARLMSWERPNHWGIRMGKITAARGSLARVLLERPLGDGDGLQTRGREEADFVYAGPNMPSGTEATVRIAGGARVGDEVVRLTDAAQMAEIRAYMAEDQRKMMLFGDLTVIPGEKPTLVFSDADGHMARSMGAEPVQAASRQPMTIETAKKQLGKLGGTPYELTELTLRGENAFMTAGQLNALRRDAIEQMRLLRTAIIHEKREPVKLEYKLPAQEKLVIAQGERLEDAGRLIDSGADVFYWLPQDWRVDRLQRALYENPDARPVLVLPAVTYTQTLNELHAFVRRNAAQISGVVLNNIGQFDVEWPIPVYGGQGLNVMNTECAKFFFALGARRLTVSCELSAKELRELTIHGGNFEMEAYGRTQLMLLSHCPRRTISGDGKQDAVCDRCRSEGGSPAVYTDRKGYRFPAKRLKMPHGCIIRLYNSVVTDMAKQEKTLAQLGLCLRVSFLEETPQRQTEVTASYANILHTEGASHKPDGEATVGQLQRGVQ